MREDAASSSSSTNWHDSGESIEWSSAQSVDRGSDRSVLRTTEKSVVFRVRTQEKVSNGGGKRASNNSSTQALCIMQSEETSGIDDANIHETLAELYAEAERKKLWLNSEEKAFQCGQQRLSSLQREHATLLHNLEQCKRRRKERLRIERMLRGPRAERGNKDYERSGSSDSNSDSDYSSSHREHRRSSRRRHRSRRDGAKKERKRLRQFQSEVSLRFQLLESECRGSSLKLDKLVADLRREYADSCLFGNALNF